MIVPAVHNLLPPVHTQVGDTLQVYFRNTLSFGVNLFLGGGVIPVDSNKATTTVPQGVTFEYTWQVRKVLRKVFTGVRGRTGLYPASHRVSLLSGQQQDLPASHPKPLHVAAASLCHDPLRQLGTVLIAQLRKRQATAP